MNKFLFSAVLLMACATKFLYGQCPNSNQIAAGNLTPPGVGLYADANYGAGQYVLAYVEVGANYTVLTCDNNGSYDPEWEEWVGGFDTQLAIYDDETGAFIAYSDDYCGLLAGTSFTASKCGWVRVCLYQYSCNGSGLLANVRVFKNTPGNSTIALAMTQASVTTCPLVPVAVGDTATGGVLPYTYSWNVPSSVEDSTSAMTHAIVNANASLVLTAKDANRCTASATVNVVTMPAAHVDLGADVVACAHAELDATQNDVTYLWNDNSTDATLAVTASGNYTVEVTNTDGCKDKDTVHITINPLPVVDLGADQSFCNASHTFDLTDANHSFIWDNGSTSSMYNTGTTGNVWVEVTDVNTGCVNSDTVHFTFNPLPTLDLGADQTQCGGTFTIDATQPHAEYVWSGNSISGSFSTLTSGEVWVQLTDTLTGCVNSDTMFVTIHPLPVVGIDQTVSTLCLQGGTAALIGSPANGEFSGTGVTGNVFTAADAGVGIHTVTYTYSDTNACEVSVSVNFTVVGCLSVDENELFDMAVFPNPSDGLVNIKVGNAAADWQIVVTDLQGKVWNEMNARNVSATTFQVDFTGYSSGDVFHQLAIGERACDAFGDY